MSNLTLREVFRFGDAELAQNRKGHLSGYQLRMLKRGGKVAFVLITLLGFVIALGVYAVNEETPLMRAAVTLGFFAVTGLYFFIRAHVLASKRKAKSVSGTVTLVYRNRVGNCLVIDNKTFPVSGNRVNGLFKANTPYTIYYTGTSSILSIEEQP